MLLLSDDVLMLFNRWEVQAWSPNQQEEAESKATGGKGMATYEAAKPVSRTVKQLAAIPCNYYGVNGNSTQY